jgi:hypothetical protein
MRSSDTSQEQKPAETFELDLNQLIQNSHSASSARVQHLIDLKCFLVAKCDKLINESESWDKDQERATYRAFALDVFTRVL